jgi:hypothetical protein
MPMAVLKEAVKEAGAVACVRVHCTPVMSVDHAMGHGLLCHSTTSKKSEV